MTESEPGRIPRRPTERAFQMLSGYKTYIAAVVAVVGAVGAYLSGDMSIAEAAQIVVTALIGAFVRNGVSNG